jgi:hypothetical protein
MAKVNQFCPPKNDTRFLEMENLCMALMEALFSVWQEMPQACKFNNNKYSSSTAKYRVHIGTTQIFVAFQCQSLNLSIQIQFF